MSVHNAAVMADSMLAVRLRPFETLTAEGRANERVRRARLTSFTGALGKVIGALGPLVTIPVCVRYLGEERYGLWMAIVSTLSLFSFADLGIGNGLVSALAQADGRADRNEAKKLVSSAFALLGAVGVLLCFGFLLGGIWAPWVQFFHLKSPMAAAECLPALTVCFLGFAVSLPLTIVQKVQYAFQEGFQSNLWQCAGSLASMAFILAVVALRGGLPWLVFGMVGVQAMVSLLNAFWYFGKQRSWLRPRVALTDRRLVGALLRTGSQFLLISILTTVGIYSDNLIVAHLLGASEVTAVSVPSRIAGILVVMAMMLYLPAWSSFSEAFARGDSAWVAGHYRKLTRVMMWLGLATSATYAIGIGPFTKLYIGPEFTVPTGLAGGLALSALGNAVGGPAFMLLNSCGKLKAQILLYLCYTPVSLASKCFAANHFGVAGVAGAGALSYLLLVNLPVHLAARQLLRSTSAK